MQTGMELKYFAGHEHPLILIEENDADEEENDANEEEEEEENNTNEEEEEEEEEENNTNEEEEDGREEENDTYEAKEYCSGCTKPILGPMFRCTVCIRFLLHKSCAELPQEMNHSGHPEHPLTLSSALYDYECDACCQNRYDLKYHCSPCQFYLDLGCAQLPQTIQHIGHQHPLTLQLKQALFCCDVCNIKHEKGFFYQCAPCHYWVHDSCTSLPSSIKHTSHNHPLTLASYSQLEALELSRFDIYCDICTNEVKPKNCVYYCAGCRYFAHIGCTTSEIENDKSDMKAEDHSPNLLCLPKPDKSSSVDLVNHLIEQISVGHHLKQCNCDHHLTLFDAQTDEICDACVRPISTPYCNCPEFNLILHKHCTELPNAIQHPLHTEHTLTLLKVAESGCFICGGCSRKYPDKGFAFHCDPCCFYVDIKCASFPTTIRHESHEHLLNLQNDLDSRCSACYQDSTWLIFKCSTCNFNLHIECALLPQTLKHRYDKHALILTYSPAGLRSDEYYCEICEEELNPKLWFYYCADCNYAFHSECIFKGC